MTRARAPPPTRHFLRRKGTQMATCRSRWVMLSLPAIKCSQMARLIPTAALMTWHAQQDKVRHSRTRTALPQTANSGRRRFALATFLLRPCLHSASHTAIRARFMRLVAQCRQHQHKAWCLPQLEATLISTHQLRRTFLQRKTCTRTPNMEFPSIVRLPACRTTRYHSRALRQ